MVTEATEVTEVTDMHGSAMVDRMATSPGITVA